MKTTLTVILVIISFHLFSQHQAIYRIQQNWIPTNEPVPYKVLFTHLPYLQLNYITDKKEEQIHHQQRIIKQKDQFIVLSIIAGSVTFAALIIIFILYGKKNHAYKLLVYKSMENTDKTTLLILNDISEEDNLLELKYTNSPLDQRLKNQIGNLLKNELESKVFVDSNLTLKMLAVKCRTNRSYFSQFIHEQYNMNFNAFINMLRINEAKLMLADKNNNLPLKKLYLQLGFNTYSVFNEAFKKHVGVTPAFYLKTIQELQDVTNPN